MVRCKVCGKDTGFYDPNMKYCYDCFMKKDDGKKLRSKVLRGITDKQVRKNEFVNVTEKDLNRKIKKIIRGY